MMMKRLIENDDEKAKLDLSGFAEQVSQRATIAHMSAIVNI